MYQFILLIHVFIAICIVALVLMQQGKGASIGAAFGSGASQTVFGSRGSGSFLFRVTLSFAAIFFITSLVLNNLATQAQKQEKVISLPIAPLQSIPVKAPAPVANKPEQTSSTVTPEEIPTKK